MPGGWQEAFGDVAFFFRCPFSELWAMEVDGWELKLWIDQAKRLKRLLSEANG